MTLKISKDTPFEISVDKVAKYFADLQEQGEQPAYRIIDELPNRIFEAVVNGEQKICVCAAKLLDESNVRSDILIGTSYWVFKNLKAYGLNVTIERPHCGEWGIYLHINQIRHLAIRKFLQTQEKPK